LAKVRFERDKCHIGDRTEVADDTELWDDLSKSLVRERDVNRSSGQGTSGHIVYDYDAGNYR
jgi:hypothetical protein